MMNDKKVYSAIMKSAALVIVTLIIVGFILSIIIQ